MQDPDGAGFRPTREALYSYWLTGSDREGQVSIVTIKPKFVCPSRCCRLGFVTTNVDLTNILSKYWECVFFNLNVNFLMKIMCLLNKLLLLIMMYILQ